MKFFNWIYVFLCFFADQCGTKIEMSQGLEPPLTEHILYRSQPQTSLVKFSSSNRGKFTIHHQLPFSGVGRRDWIKINEEMQQSKLENVLWVGVCVVFWLKNKNHVKDAFIISKDTKNLVWFVLSKQNFFVFKSTKNAWNELKAFLFLKKNKPHIIIHKNQSSR